MEFRDQTERVRRCPAYTSKAASEELGRNLVKLVAYHRATGGQTDPALAAWFESLPTNVRKLLLKWTLIAPERVGVSQPLTDHFAHFAAALGAKGNTERHIAFVMAGPRR